MSILNLDVLHENQLSAAGEIHPEVPQTRLHFPSGRTVVIPTAVLLADKTSLPPLAGEGALSETRPSATPEALDRPQAAAQTSPAAHTPPLAPAESVAGRPTVERREAAVIPLIEERIEIAKRVVEKERIQLHRQTEEVLQHISVPLQQISWQVEHVPVGKLVEHRPEPRQEGDVTIYPLVEERLVTSTELFLREEVHVRRIVTTVEHRESISLRKDTLTETHLKPSS